jgi:PAS domain S-box-containing protein
MSEHRKDAESARIVSLDGEAPGRHEEPAAPRGQATKKLREAERRYRELVEHSLGLICTHDLTGTILTINPAAASSLGYRPEDGIGHNLREFLSAETRHLFDEYLRRIQNRGLDDGLMRVVSRTGAMRVWMYRNVLSHDPDGVAYVLGHAIDITDRIAAERKLRDQEKSLLAAHAELEARVKERTAALERANDRLRIQIAEREKAEQSRERLLLEQRNTLAFLSNFSDHLAPLVTFEDLVDVVRRLPVPFLAEWTMIHIVEEDGSIRCVAGVHAAMAKQEMLTDLAATASREVPADSDLARLVATGKLTILTGTPDDLSRTLIGPGPMTTIMQLGIATAAMIPLVVRGRVRAVVSLISANASRFAASGALVVEDVARRIRLALDRIQLYREAQEANRLKDEFLSTLSHELRTPLNAIFGWAQILRMGNLDEDAAHAAEAIERSARAQIRLIEELLDVSRITTGKMKVMMERVDVAAILRATIDILLPTIEGKGIMLQERIHADLPTLFADPYRLQQVFWNLLSNALKFTGPGDEITVTLRAEPRWIEFEITDTGVGIRPTVLPFVFDRFRQGDSSTARSHGGLGLGLAIVKHIVELHSGKIRVASAGEECGATFTIQLPIEEGPQATTAGVPPRQEPRHEDSEVLLDNVVLVVEDHDDSRELTVRVLESAGARVLSAATAEEALDRVSNVRPDAVVADLGLPGQDGYALLARLRALYNNIPAIAVTGYAQTNDRDRAFAAGFQEYLVKPIDPYQLVRIVASRLRSQ